MDDDLLPLRGNPSGNDDDLFGAFADPDDLGFDAVPSSASSADRLPDLDAFDFSAFEEPSAPAPSASPATTRARTAPRSAAKPSAKPTPQPKTAKPRRRRRAAARTGAFGMTPQQQMILSIFLFLDVSVLGLLILLVIGAISF